MKKVTGINDTMSPMSEETKDTMPTLRELLRLMGNTKADNADEARRIRRLVVKLQDKTATDLVIENEDHAFLIRTIEKNSMNLTAWMQGQILDRLEAAERVEPSKVD